FPAQPGETGADVLVEPHSVGRKRIPKLPREPSSADVPVRQDDRLAVRRGDRLAEAEHRGSFIDHPNVARHAEGPQRPPVVLPLHDDWRVAVLVREVFEDLFEILVQSIPVHQSSPNGGGRVRPDSVRAVETVRPFRCPPDEPAGDKGCEAEAIKYRPPDMHDVPGEEEVNFERVTKVYREESGKKTLVSLEADFYDRLATYIGRLEESADRCLRWLRVRRRTGSASSHVNRCAREGEARRNEGRSG